MFTPFFWRGSDAGQWTVADLQLSGGQPAFTLITPTDAGVHAVTNEGSRQFLIRNGPLPKRNWA